MPDRTTVRDPAMPSASQDRAAVSNPQNAASGGTRSRAGSNYGDFAPPASGAACNPSRGAEMERDVAPPYADFSRPPQGSQAAQAGEALGDSRNAAAEMDKPTSPPLDRDPNRIDVEEIFQLRDWADQLGVNEDEIRAAVQAVGDNADKVAAYLQEQKRAKGIL